MKRSLVIYMVPGLRTWGQQVVNHPEITGDDVIESIMRALEESSGHPWKTIIIQNIITFEEPPADVRMSAASLMELQRVTAAHAVEAWARQYTDEDEEQGAPRSNAYSFAEKIRYGQVKL